MREFFVDEVRNGHAQIAGEEARHLTRVLRVEAGQRYEISDNRNVYLAEIETARKENVVFRTLEKLPAAPPSARFELYAALIKFDRFEWMVEKATELGVTEIVPVEATRSERGLEKAAAKRVERWRRIALEASQQSRRAHLPEIAEPVPLADALARTGTYRYALDENPGAVPLLQALPAVRTAQDTVAILTGPEGGWTEEERVCFTAAGWTPVSMGPLILRAETAVIAALAVVIAGVAGKTKSVDPSSGFRKSEAPSGADSAERHRDWRGGDADPHAGRPEPRRAGRYGDALRGHRRGHHHPSAGELRVHVFAHHAGEDRGRGARPAARRDGYRYVRQIHRLVQFHHRHSPGRIQCDERRTEGHQGPAVSGSR